MDLHRPKTPRGSSARPRPLEPLRLRLEALEDRTLPSTITWVNEGNDNFEALFGANAPTARLDVQAGLLAWENLITSFNYADGTNNLNLSISFNPAVQGAHVQTPPGLITADAQGKPRSAVMYIGNASWYVDAVPTDSSEFKGFLYSPYVRGANGSVPPSEYDLYSAVTVGMAAVAGLTPLQSEALVHSPYVASTGQQDAVDPSGSLYTFYNPNDGLKALFTSSDGGGNDFGPAHTARPGNIYFANGITFKGVYDSDNATSPAASRILPSLLDALVLRDVYGYTINTGTPEFQYLVSGADAGGGPEVKVYDPWTGVLKSAFMAYEVTFTGGVRVAVADVNGDGIPDILTSPGPGRAPEVKVFNGLLGSSGKPALIYDFDAYSPQWTGGVFIAGGDIEGDGYADIVTGADAGGGPQVTAFSGRTGAVIYSIMAYDVAFTGGVRVAVGDVNGDGYADIITGAGPGGGPEVRVFSGYYFARQQKVSLFDFMAYDPAFSGGVYVAAGDVNGDGYADVLTGAGKGGGPEVKVFDGYSLAYLHQLTLLQDFYAYDPRFPGGVRVAAADLNYDGKADIITGAGPGGGPELRVLDGQTLSPILDFMAYDPRFPGGIFVAAG